MKGYIKVPHDFFKWLYSKDLSGVEIKMVLFVLQKTIGWNKESDKISITQFEKELNVSRRGITKALKRLENSSTLVKTKGKINSYKLGNASTLLLGNKKVLTRELGGKKLGNCGTTTIYNTKEYIQKDCYTMEEIIEKERQRLKSKQI